MNVERIGKTEIRIKLDAELNDYGYKRIFEYLKYLEATSSSKATQDQIDTLANEVNESWWAKNKSRFIK